MADKSINQLPVSDGLTDDGLLVVYQNSETKSIRGNLIKQFAQQGIEAAMAAAKENGEFDGKDGVDGKDGEDAVSPTVAVSNITGGHRITITDKNGTKTVDVMDGSDGQDGYTPVKGKDYNDGADGKDGYTPQKNVDYFDGEDGADGVSPTIAVTNITGGHRLTITDANGTKTVDVMDGEDGANGMGSGDMLTSEYDPQGKRQDVFAYVDNAVKNAVSTDDIDAAVSEALEEAKASGEFDGADGKDGADGYTPVKGVDYFDGADGVSGVYLGSDTPPANANVWIDPTGEASTLEMTATFADGTTQTYVIYGEVAE